MTLEIYIETFSEVRRSLHRVRSTSSLSKFQWICTYDVYIDNTVGGASAADVDFFTFTGLTAGSLVLGGSTAGRTDAASIRY